MEDKATPRPWRVFDTYAADFLNELPPRREDVTEIQHAETGELLAYACPKRASLIVRAVNSYETHRHLVDTISGIVSWLEMPTKTREIIEAALGAVAAAEKA